MLLYEVLVYYFMDKNLNTKSNYKNFLLKWFSF